MATAYGRLPLQFEANDGQTDPQVKFIARGLEHTLFLTSSEAVLVLTGPNQMVRGQPDQRVPIRQTVLRMTFLGANPQADVAGLEELAGKANYFIGNDRAQWRTNVPLYAEVRYHDLYPGIDLSYHGDHRQVHVEFVVGPRADPERIVINWQGAEAIEVDPQGNLVLHAASGLFLQRKPDIYQELAGVRRKIDGGYVLKGTHQVGFEMQAYDPRRSLVIEGDADLFITPMR